MTRSGERCLVCGEELQRGAIRYIDFNKEKTKRKMAFVIDCKRGVFGDWVKIICKECWNKVMENKLPEDINTIMKTAFLEAIEKKEPISDEVEEKGL